MNFLDAQERAERARQHMLLVVFLAMASVPAAGMGTALWQAQRQVEAPLIQFSDIWRLSEQPLLISLLLFSAVVAVSVIRLFEIRSLGGAGLATKMGGREVTSRTLSPKERQLLNVVEEIGVAASMVPPRVFVLNHQLAPNALSLGRGLDDGVLLITKGLLHTLKRDELQAVVAHEIAHLRQGDAALNTWLLGIFEGLSVFSAPARFVLGTVLKFRFTETRRTWDSKLALYSVMALLIGCMVIWWHEPVFGNMLLASVIAWTLVHVARARITREMEYRADAVAVQLTRYPRSMAAALSIVTRYYEEAPGDAIRGAGHMLFVRTHPNSRWGDLTASHPRSEDRIRRLSSEVLTEHLAHGAPTHAPYRSSVVDRMAFSGQSMVAVDQADADQAAVDEAEAMTNIIAPLNTMVLMSLSPDLRRNLREAKGARLALLAVIQSQLGLKTGLAPDENPFLEVCHSWGEVSHLPLLDVSLSVLRSQTPDERLSVLAEVERLMHSVSSPDLVGYALHRIVRGGLAEPGASKPGVVELVPSSAQEHIAILLTQAVHLQPTTPAEQAAAFAAAMMLAPETGRWVMHKGTVSAAQVEAALLYLAAGNAAFRRKIVEAVERAVMHDDQLTVQEEIWLRAVAQALNC